MIPAMGIPSGIPREGSEYFANHDWDHMRVPFLWRDGGECVDWYEGQGMDLTNSIGVNILPGVFSVSCLGVSGGLRINQ